jgi:hypothetical protein
MGVLRELLRSINSSLKWRGIVVVHNIFAPRGACVTSYSRLTAKSESHQWIVLRYEMRSSSCLGSVKPLYFILVPGLACFAG